MSSLLSSPSLADAKTEARKEIESLRSDLAYLSKSLGEKQSDFRFDWLQGFDHTRQFVDSAWRNLGFALQRLDN